MELKIYEYIMGYFILSFGKINILCEVEIGQFGIQEIVIHYMTH